MSHLFKVPKEFETKMNSSILLICDYCTEKIGSMDIEDISLVSAEEIIHILETNRIYFMCPTFQCQHEFTD
jgi:hypothetical protein